MAEEDVLRMRATLRDQASPGLAQLRKQLATVGQGVDTSKVRKEFADLQRHVTHVTGSLTGTSGLLNAFGQFRGAGGGIVVGLAAIGAAFYGMGRQLQEFADKTADLKFAARDMGVSVQELKAFQRAAREVRIDPSAALSAMQTFTRNAEDFRLRIGGVREELYKLGAGDVVEAIGRAKTPMDALRLAFERMQQIQQRDPAAARRLAESMFGTAAAARMSWQEIQRLNQQYVATGRYSAEAIAQSEAFRQQWEKFDDTLTKLKERTLTPLFPAFTRGLEAINTLIDKTKTGVEWIEQHLGSGAERAPNYNPRAGGQQRGREERRKWWQEFWKGSGAARLGGGHPNLPSKEGDDLKRQAGDLAENFKKMNFELSRPGAGGGGGGIINASFGGGGFAARGGGGFRGFGSAEFPKLGPFGPGGPTGGGAVPRSFNNPQGGTSASGANPLTSPQSDAVAGPRSEGGMYNWFQRLGRDRPFARNELQTIETPFGKALVHPDAAADFSGFYGDLGKAGAPIKRLGSYNPRPKRWGGGWSSHAMGAATDIDDQQFFSPAMQRWLAANPEKWKEIKERWNIGQPLPAKDPAHLEWRGPHGSKFADGGGSRFGANGTPSAEGTGKSVKGSWFGSGPGWHDPSEPAGKLTASGEPLSVPGIALPSRSTLGQMFEVTIPDGRKFTLPQTDLGPAARTRRGIDINSAAATQMGYSAKTFPTDARFSYRRIDEALAKGAGGGKAEGTVNVNVHAPGGTKVDAQSDGLFQSTRIQRYRQMGETGLDGGAQ